MLHVEVETPSPPSTGPTSSPAPPSAAALAALSRNASVISSSSSSSSSSSLLLNTVRPRPLRTFSSPRNRSPAGGPPTPTRTKAPIYLSKEPPTETTVDANNTQTRTPASKSRSNSAAGRLGPNDFEFGEVLGEGSYSTVMAAVYPPKQKEYAIKIIDKEHLVRKEMVKTANVEKNVLMKLGIGGHPGVVRLHWTFQDQWSLFFVLDLVPNGELQSRISRLGSICLPCARWYTAQMIDTIVYMHERGVIHRDLKPENVLLDNDMRVKITDFGSAKMFEPRKEDERSNSWVGTPQYVPPELLFHNITCKSSDFWAIGCILYQMIAGKFPFQGLSNYLMWGKIKALDYSFPDEFDDTARDLVQKLLVLDPEARLGAGEPGTWNDLAALRAHPFFHPLSWDRLWTDPVPPLEAGIFRREINSNGSGDAFDVGAEWERLIGAEMDEEGQEQQSECVEPDSNDDTGPPICTPNGLVAEPGVVGSEGEALTDTHHVSPALPPAGSTPLDVRDSASSSGGSTAGGSPTERLGGFLESLTLSSRSRRPSTTSNSSTAFSDPTRWMSLLRPSETPVFTSCVHKAPRRTFPRQLLPLGGSTKKNLNIQGKDKDKARLLVLTKTRLLCLKERDGAAVVKDEVLIGGQGSGNGVVIGVERGEKTFVVQTASKSYTFTTDDPALAARWEKEIGDALPSNGIFNSEQQLSAPERT